MSYVAHIDIRLDFGSLVTSEGQAEAEAAAFLEALRQGPMQQRDGGPYRGIEIAINNVEEIP